MFLERNVRKLMLSNTPVQAETYHMTYDLKKYLKKY